MFPTVLTMDATGCRLSAGGYNSRRIGDSLEFQLANRQAGNTNSGSSCASNSVLHRHVSRRAGFILMGLYGLLVGLTAMYYAGKLGLVSVTMFTDNYIGFTIYVIVVVCVGIGFLSLLKTTRTPA
jgi:hypothetical protein